MIRGVVFSLIGRRCRALLRLLRWGVGCGLRAGARGGGLGVGWIGVWVYYGLIWWFIVRFLVSEPILWTMILLLVVRFVAIMMWLV